MRLRIFVLSVGMFLMAGCLSKMRPKDMATIYLHGGGPISMVSLEHNEEGRQLFVAWNVPSGQRRRGELIEIHRTVENRILKLLGEIQKIKALPASGPRGAPLLLEVHLRGDKPKAFRVETTWGADPRVGDLIETINAVLPRNFKIAPPNATP